MTSAGADNHEGATGEWALRLLLHHGLLTAREVVTADLRAEETSMSHTAYCVRVGGVARWYVKRADLTRSQGRDLGSEASVYRLAVHHPVLREVAPRCRLIGENDNAVVIDAVAGTPLQFVISAPVDRVAERVEVLKAYGSAVARVHSVRCPAFGNRPWMIEALEPRWRGYSWLPRRSASLLSQLAVSPKHQQAFRQAQAEWRPVCLVHGDLRWSNALAAGRDEQAAIKLIDWELASLGDPAWDVGGFLADAIGTAVLERGAHPSVEYLLAQSASILSGYYVTARPPREVWAALMKRSLRLAGVRLVQTIIEYEYAFGRETAAVESALMPWSTWLLDAGAAISPQVVRAVEQAAA
jgi:aminoglycoside phosphotransferase (APT) family kinase protein